MFKLGCGKKAEVLGADGERPGFSDADSVVALPLTSIGGEDGGGRPPPTCPHPAFLPDWHLSAPVLSILGRHCFHLCIIFQSRPVSMATDRLKAEQRAGGEAGVSSPGGGVCP